MNQILGKLFIEPNTLKNSFKKEKFIFFFCIIVVVACIILYIYLNYNSTQNKKIAKNLESKFEIRNLYSNMQSTYIAEKVSVNNTSYEPFVIGLMKIDKINLVEPILSNISDELLEISPCRFYGPMPNKIGNMCIAGHNYANQTHFAKLHLLKTEDIIQIYDLNGSKIDYYIYDKKEVSSNDTSCLSQDTNSSREITLITCNSIKGNRTILKAREVNTKWTKIIK